MTRPMRAAAQRAVEATRADLSVLERHTRGSAADDDDDDDGVAPLPPPKRRRGAAAAAVESDDDSSEFEDSAEEDDEFVPAARRAGVDSAGARAAGDGDAEESDGTADEDDEDEPEAQDDENAEDVAEDVRPSPARGRRGARQRQPRAPRAARAPRARRAVSAAGESAGEPANEDPESEEARRRARVAAAVSRRLETQRLKMESAHPDLRGVWSRLEDLPTSASQSVAVSAAASDPSDVAIKALRVKLLPFQHEGVRWMQMQERPGSPFPGGILADEMGMGKTLQTIALILAQQRAGDAPTLVVTPAVALMQWRNEINKYVEPGILTVRVFHGDDRATDRADLESAHIILTTYSTIEIDHRRQEYGLTRKGEKVKVPSLLHAVRWHRVVLDEAHAIKDRSCATARAVFALHCTYKWNLTGTPLQNRIGELYSLIRFMVIYPYSYYFCRQCDCKSLSWRFHNYSACVECGHKPMAHFCWWNSEVLRPIQRAGNSGDGAVAFRRLGALLQRIMLRRTKIERAEDLGLPPRAVFLRRHYFNEEEADFYRALYSESRTRFASYVADGSVLNNYAHIFELLMRMRQAVNHPYLVTHKRAANDDGGGHGLICGICQEDAEDPVAASCKHVFCREDVRMYVSSSAAEKTACPVCFRPFTVDLNQPPLTMSSDGPAARTKRQSIMNRVSLSTWRSSTKIEALLEELSRLRDEQHAFDRASQSPGQMAPLTATGATTKAIVFSQFVGFLDIIEWRLQRAGFRCVKLDGTMTPQQRDAIINAFSTIPSVQVFLISLKAGGVALNLTEASHVFLMDPWWNPAVEAQAMDRIHRLGQYRPIQIKRLIVEDSIEGRIVQLQEKKNLMFQSTVGMDADALNRLTEEDLRFLFIM